MTCLVWLKIVLHDWLFCISLLINAVDPRTLSPTQVVMPKSHMLVGKLAGHFLHTYLIVQLKTPCYRCCLFSPAFFVCVTSYEGGQDALVSNRHCRPKGLLSVCSEPPSLCLLFLSCCNFTSPPFWDAFECGNRVTELNLSAVDAAWGPGRQLMQRWTSLGGALHLSVPLT